MVDRFYCTLPNRGTIIVSGKDRESFLQGLITNDITQARADGLLYACLLTPQGKFLHDFFVRLDGDTYVIDCEGGARALDLYERLVRFRLRAKVTLEIQEDTPVFAVFGNDTLGFSDPRHSDMGRRCYERSSLDTLEERAFDADDSWDMRRIMACVPDGARDLAVEKSTLDEGSIDQLYGVSYDKGCYIGQELTARMHYRGLGKKKLSYVRFSDARDDVIEVRSSCGDHAIALVKAVKS